MSSKVEKDVAGALGFLGDFFGRDAPSLKKAADHVRARVGVKEDFYGNPTRPKRGDATAPPFVPQPGGGSGAAPPTAEEPQALDMKECGSCGAFYVTECMCGAEESDVEYAVHDKRGAFVRVELDSDAALDLALAKGGFVRPQRRKP